MLLGTPRYMAPERRTGMRADPRVDVYGAGRIFEELLQAVVAEPRGGGQPGSPSRPRSHADTPAAAGYATACRSDDRWREAKDFARLGSRDAARWLHRIAAKARAPSPELRFGSALRMQLTLQTAWAAQLEP
jgi:serine/threonine protein kinase